MKREIALAHWRRETRALSAANSLAIGGQHDDSVSRSYYAMMHAAKAALATRDLEAESHNAVQKLFNQHLVKPGDIDKQRGVDLGRARQRRSTADYDISREASEGEAFDGCRRATAFLIEIRILLRNAGLYEDDLAPVVVSDLPG